LGNRVRCAAVSGREGYWMKRKRLELSMALPSVWTSRGDFIMDC